MDADLSHPPEILPKLVSLLKEDRADIVIASRLVKGGGVIGNWPQHRKLNSYVATFMAKFMTSVKDPMSGFILFKKEIIDNVTLIPRGYKIGLEILVKGHYDKVIEVPFLFDNRNAGKSKLNLRVQLDYIRQITHLYLYLVRRFVAAKRIHIKSEKSDRD
jgi:dolichol-phosphate mannosyltransferase